MVVLRVKGILPGSVIRHTISATLHLNLFGIDRCGLVMAVGPVGAQQCRQQIGIISVAVLAIAEGIDSATEQPEILKAVKPSTW